MVSADFLKFARFDTCNSEELDYHPWSSASLKAGAATTLIGSNGQRGEEQGS